MAYSNDKKRTREQLVIDTFLYMIRHGDAFLTHVSVPLATGGTMEKVIYRVKPD